MKSLRLLALAVALAVMPAGALAQTSPPSNTNCTLAACNLGWAQNGIQSFVHTYKVSLSNQAVAATPTDILTITGSSTKTLRITKIVLAGGSTAAGSIQTAVIRRGALDTGGTATNPAIAARDTHNATLLGGIVTLYSANPTLGSTAGAGAGTLDTCRLFLNTATGASPDVCAFTYGINNDQLTVIRGATDQIAVNLQGSTLPAGTTIDIDVEYTEEPTNPL